MSEHKPHFEHDCDACEYKGTIHVGDDADDGFFDVYRCEAHGTGMTVLRGDAEDEPLTIPDAGIAALLGAAITSATKGEEEAGPLLIACGVAIAQGAKPIGGAE
jgi:hypothetical protein